MSFEQQFAKAILESFKEKNVEPTEQDIDGVLKIINQSIKKEIQELNKK